MDAAQPTIRHATVADAEAVSRIFAGPKAIWGTLQIPYAPVETWRERLSQPERGFIPLVACMDGEPVGMLGLHTHPDRPRVRHAATLGMAVRDDWQGRGVGTALMEAALDMADRWLQLTRVELNVFVGNDGALRLYRRFGFEVEGRLRQAAFCDGRLIDVLVMGRLRPPSEPGGRGDDHVGNES